MNLLDKSIHRLLWLIPADSSYPQQRAVGDKNDVCGLNIPKHSMVIAPPRICTIQLLCRPPSTYVTVSMPPGYTVQLLCPPKIHNYSPKLHSVVLFSICNGTQ